ncbi:hypothetical protein [Sporosarcina sp. FSL W7-1283]|uniref:hypothetical protein n=1 Tax=Sporosarcina sp. FSL W7-1283 TaxID=2921560 RepID=UPI0030FC4D32
MTQFTLIQENDKVLDRSNSKVGTVTSIDHSFNKAVVKLDGIGTNEIMVSKLFDLVKVTEEQGTADPDKWWSWVRAFQLAFNHPAPENPTMLSKERIETRNSWMEEECDELFEAETLEDQVDAAIDKLYFALGDLVELGVKPDKLLEIVQKANMGKLHNIDGKLTPVYKEDGKVKKPDDWEEKCAPESKLKEEIERQLNNK